ncbi:hypothetical protein IFM89_039261 [Coptis chinensis]|uniref:Pentatricopeptide repeat-containing protein n=1 Tax=Coptis chinensis TaxID=261450 RepID=A0A835ILS7_9MAGN|nr:hypothetical protein IFM89_039261 [Coptis chinensis]
MTLGKHRMSPASSLTYLRRAGILFRFDNSSGTCGSAKIMCKDHLVCKKCTCIPVVTTHGASDILGPKLKHRLLWVIRSESSSYMGFCQVFDVVVGVQVHCVALKLGLDLFEFCESGFINLYAKAGDFGNARKVFEQSPERKLGSWNAIISGLTHAGHAKEAISMFMELLKSGLEPDDVTMVGVTSACGSLGDLNLGLQLHKCVFQAKRFEKSDMLMLNSLIDVYGKCGRMELAYKVFVGMVERTVLTWTSLIMGFAMHGHVRDALECFHCMREAGVRPNYVTFVGVLSACVHGGLVQEGRRYFNMMIDEYGIMPKLPHYGVMVDLLGRAGLLEEAKDMVENMPMEANVIIWGALMGACEKHGSVEMAEWVAKHLEELEPWNDGVYVVLSNVYAGAGMWEEVERIRMIMKGRSVAKTPAYSATTV